MSISVPPDYKPTENEDFMSEIMLEHFRKKLLDWKSDLLKECNLTLQQLQLGNTVEADIADRASVETDRSLELRTRDRARKLISKIDAALVRIDNGSYGYCEDTDEPIGLKRLEARPIASLTLDAQEKHERMEKVHKED